jgi:hypothetical protein
MARDPQSKQKLLLALRLSVETYRGRLWPFSVMEVEAAPPSGTKFPRGSGVFGGAPWVKLGSSGRRLDLRAMVLKHKLATVRLPAAVGVEAS